MCPCANNWISSHLHIIIFRVFALSLVFCPTDWEVVPCSCSLLLREEPKGSCLVKGSVFLCLVPVTRFWTLFQPLLGCLGRVGKWESSKLWWCLILSVDLAVGCPDIWSNIIPGVLGCLWMRLTFESVVLSKADCPPQCGWASCN